MWIIYVCAKGRLCRSFCLQLRGAAPHPQPPRFLKPIDGCKEKEQASGFMLALKEGCADHFVCNWGGLRPAQPPRFLKAIDGCKKRTSVRIYVCAKRNLKAIDGCKEKEQQSGFMLALKEGCADHFVCNWGGLRPPQPPCFLKAIDGCNKRTSVRIYVGAKERLCGSFCLQLGGAAPRPTPPLFKGHRWLQKKN